MFVAIFLWAAVGCCSNVLSLEVTITRGTNDVIQFSNCTRSNRTFCRKFNANPYGNDERLCSCQCKSNFVMYRDPGVLRSIRYEPGKPKCVWWSYNHEGCTRFKISGRRRARRPIIIDLATNGVVSGLEANINESCLGIVPYVKEPGNETWTRVNISFTLQKISNNNYSLQWQRDSSNAYQGMAMRLDVCGKNPNSNCIMTKVGGTYTDPRKCKQRTIDGQCCVFPFIVNGTIYNDCSYDQRFDEQPWCAVNIKFNIEPFNRDFRGLCAATSSTTALPSPSVATPASPRVLYQYLTSPIPTVSTLTSFSEFSSSYTSATPISAQETPTATTFSTASPSLLANSSASSAMIQFSTEILLSSTLTPQVSVQVTLTDVSSSKSSVEAVATPSPTTLDLTIVTLTSRTVTFRNPSANESSDSSRILSVVIGVAVALVVLLIIGLIAVICIPRRKGKVHINEKVNIGNRTNQGFEASYACAPESSPKKVEKLDNPVYFESLEMTPEGPLDQEETQSHPDMSGKTDGEPAKSKSSRSIFDPPESTDKEQ